MAAMGEMIGNIAHQWRQPLSVISTASTSIKLKKEKNLLRERVSDRNYQSKSSIPLALVEISILIILSKLVDLPLEVILLYYTNRILIRRIRVNSLCMG